MTLSDLAKYSMTRSARGLSATAELFVKIMIDDVTLWSKLESTILHGKSTGFC